MIAVNIPKKTPAEPDGAEAERRWWDEVGVLVEHEIWHLPRLADEQDGEPGE